MGVRLHFQSTGTVLGQGAPVPMVGPALTIGRDPQNDLCLPDPSKVISKNHCAVEEHDGRYFVVDISTNGTFLNYAKDPIGAVATPLNDGDILTIGNYELMVEIREPAQAPATPDLPLDTAPMPAAGTLDDLVPSGAGDGDDFLDDLLGGDAAPVGPAGVTRPDPADDGLLPPLGEDDGILDPLPEPDYAAASPRNHAPAEQDAFRPQTPAATIPDNWEDDLGLPGPSGDPFAVEPVHRATPVPDAIPQQPAEPPAPRMDTAPPVAADPDPVGTDIPEPPPPEPVAAADTPAPGAAGDNAAARAFLTALGADGVDIPDDDLERTMVQLGTVMATMVQGIREILMTRASIKSEFRIQQTVITAGGNNPLKFSISPEQAVEALVRPAKGYLPPREAADQALGDIKAHEVAMMSAMEAALKGVLNQFAPEHLETQFTQGSGLSGLLQGKKARYWDVFESMYARISDQAENDFHELFSKEFARAYQAQADRLK
ncbi:MAG: type VI secretion system-associated FHA domain protein TagH [Marinibacterium sp.]